MRRAKGAVAGRAVYAKRLTRPTSMRGVERQLALIAAVPVALQWAEHRALRHRTAVDVQGDGDVVFAGIADGVVFVRRDQAAGRAGADVHRAARFEAIAFGVVLDEF